MADKRKHVEDLRGASRLATEATRGIVDLVEAMHHTIGGGPRVLNRPLEGAVRVATCSASLRSIMGVGPACASIPVTVQSYQRMPSTPVTTPIVTP